MRKPVYLRCGCFLLAAALLATSCDMFTDEGDDPDIILGDIVSTYGSNQLIKADALPAEEKTEESKTPVESDREDFVAYEIRIKETRNLTDITNLGQNDDILYPGALIEGTGAAAGSMTPAVLPYGITRRPMTLSMGGLSGTVTDTSFTIENPSLSATRNGINAKLTELVGASAAARIEFSKEEVYSSTQLSLSLGVGVEWPTGQSVSGQVDFSSTQEKSRVVVRFKQIYFSVDMDTPTSLNDLFSGGNAATVNDFIADKRPMYVSRVFYGRQVFFVVESTCSTDELKAAVDAAFEKGAEGAEAKVSVNAALTNKTVLQNSSIKAIIYGGDSAGAVQTISGGYDGLINFITQGASFNAATGSDALPLCYQMRFVEDNKIGAISSNAEYTMKQYVRVKQRVQVKLSNLHCTGSDDGLFDSNSEIMGSISVRAVNAPTESPAWQALFNNIGSPIEMSDGSDYPRQDSVTIGFTALSATASYIELSLHFIEDDGLDDDLGTQTPKIYLSDNWNTRHQYYFDNDDEGVRTDIDIMALP